MVEFICKFMLYSVYRHRDTAICICCDRILPSPESYRSEIRAPEFYYRTFGCQTTLKHSPSFPREVSPFIIYVIDGKRERTILLTSLTWSCCWTPSVPGIPVCVSTIADNNAQSSRCITWKFTYFYLWTPKFLKTNFSSFYLVIFRFI